MKRLISNSYWYVSLGRYLNAVNGTNHAGTVVRIHRRKGGDIVIPLPVFREIAKRVSDETEARD